MSNPSQFENPVATTHFYQLLLQEAFSFLSSTPESRLGHLNVADSGGVDRGFWGPTDSSIDWCEPNYVVTYYIAEFFNTLSAVPMVVWPILGLILCRKYGVNEQRFIFSFLSLSFVGCGSIAFHATLRYHAQLLDEIPMMINCYCTLYCAVETCRVKRRFSSLLIIISVGVFNILSYVVFQWFVVFWASFCAVIVIQVVIILRYILRYWREMSPHFWLFLTTVILIVCSVLIWTVENMFCQYVKGLQLHSFWHLGGGMALYLWNLVLVVIRGQYLKKSVSLRHSKKALLHYVEWDCGV